MTELEERRAVEFVEMQDGPIATFFEENDFSKLMLIELVQVILHDQLYWRLFASLIALNIGPLMLSSLIFQF